jgi:hypothetical protein
MLIKLVIYPIRKMVRFFDKGNPNRTMPRNRKHWSNQYRILNNLPIGRFRPAPILVSTHIHAKYYPLSFSVFHP